MKILLIEPIFGLSGDMLLAGLIDLGFDKSVLEREIEKIVGQRVLIEVREKKSNGFVGKNIKISFNEEGERDYRQISSLIKKSGLSPFVKKNALLSFESLAEVEGKIHGIAKKNVHFHELSGIDTIVDIVGYFLAIESLKIKKIFVSPIPLGYGFINTSHGIMPNPAFATMELLRGFSVYRVNIDRENITPTSAVLLKSSAENLSSSNFRIEKIGYGTGSYSFKGYPNMVRLSLGTSESETSEDEIISFSFNVDDISSETLGYFTEKVMKEGALDIAYTPIFMKKGRPAYEVNLLVSPFDFNKFLDIIFSETTTLGVRFNKLKRYILKRNIKKIETSLGIVRIKESKYKNKTRIKPEYEDVREIAQRKGLPLEEVKKLILKDMEE